MIGEIFAYNAGIAKIIILELMEHVHYVKMYTQIVNYVLILFGINVTIVLILIFYKMVFVYLVRINTLAV